MPEAQHHWVTANLNSKNLEKVSTYLRKRFGVDNHQKFPVMEVLEKELPKLDECFTFDIIGEEDWKYGVNIHAMCDISHHTIQIREDVYKGAANENGRDRFTITHEIAHYSLFALFGCPVYKSYSSKQESTKKEDDPEWQADTLAGHLLCTKEILAKSHNVNELMKNAGVGFLSAKCSLKQKRYFDSLKPHTKEVKHVKRRLKTKRPKNHCSDF